MTSLIWSVAIILGLVVLAYQRASIVVWTIASVTGLIIISVLSPFNQATITLFWMIFIALAIVLNKSFLRLNYISKALFPIFKKAVPKMSVTEKEAINVGTVKWARELFAGTPNWFAMIKKPGVSLSLEEKAFLEGPTEELCRMIDDWDITHNRMDLPPEMWQFIKNNGFLGMIIPKEYGGLDFSATAHSAIITKIAAYSIVAATHVSVPNSLGPAELILKYGTDQQKKYYLPRLAKGEDIPCFALTGPEAGSDATSLTDSGIVCKGEFEGKEIIGLRLNFNKRYITLAPIATVIGLAFKMYDPDHLLGEKENIGITCALLPRDVKGIVIGRRHFPVNVPFQNGPVSGKDVFIPLDWIIGGVEKAGKGWTMLVECLSVGRGISLPAMSAGGSKIGARVGGAYARIRQQFGIPIGSFEGIEEALTRVAGFTYMIEAMREMTVATIDQGEKPVILTAIIKYHATELGRQVGTDLMDIHGGKGVCLGPTNYITRNYQAIPISITVEGANILTRSMIIFGQGAIRCHPFIYKEMDAASDKDPEKGLEKFDQAIFGHLGFIISNFVRTVVLAFTSSRVVLTPNSKGKEKRYYQHLTRLSSAFALMSDVTMAVLGSNLKKKEKLSARLGDILSYLYIGSAILKRFHDEGSKKEDEPLLHWSCQFVLNHIQNSFSGILRNYPNRFVAALLRLIIFPLGKHFHKPSDRLGAKVANLLLEPNAARDRLTKDLCITPKSIHVAGRVEDALLQVIAIEPLETKIKKAVQRKEIAGKNYYELIDAAIRAKLITEEESQKILAAHKARLEVINVDDFDPRELLFKTPQNRQDAKTPRRQEKIN